MKPEFHSHLTYNPLQKITENFIEEDCNIVCMAPTSAGKTYVIEQFLFTAIAKGQKAIYLSPLKALTEEKRRAWEQLHELTIATGDYNKTLTFSTPLILMTTEMLDSKTRGAAAWLKAVGAIAVDEAHLLSSPSRGDSLEVGLMRFSAINREARIVLLSATIPNASAMARWLTKLNGKATRIARTEWRPVQQSHHLIRSGSKPWDVVRDTKRIVQKLSRGDKQILIFVHAVGRGISLSRELGCPFHYSKVPKEKRKAIEEAFSQKKIKRLVATSTLAYGVNLPADIVVISGATRGPMEVDAMDIKQEAGRAGRYGLSEHGDVYYVFEDYLCGSYYESCMKTPDVNSVLKERLYFHIVSFVYREGMQRSDIKDFCARAFADDLDVDGHIAKLQEAGVLTEGEYLQTTKIGKAAALMYLDPLDLVELVKNLRDRPTTPSAIAKAFAEIPSYAVPCYIPDDIDEDPLGCRYAQQTIIATCLRNWMRGNELMGTFTVLTPVYVRDIERWASGLSIAGIDPNYIKTISIMLSKGIPQHLIELCSKKGIGRKKAMKLYEAGIRNLDDVVAQKAKATALIGKKLVEDIIVERSGSGKVILNF